MGGRRVARTEIELWKRRCHPHGGHCGRGAGGHGQNSGKVDEARKRIVLFDYKTDAIQDGEDADAWAKRLHDDYFHRLVALAKSPCLLQSHKRRVHAVPFPQIITGFSHPQFGIPARDFFPNSALWIQNLNFMRLMEWQNAINELFRMILLYSQLGRLHKIA